MEEYEVLSEEKAMNIKNSIFLNSNSKSSPRKQTNLSKTKPKETAFNNNNQKQSNNENQESQPNVVLSIQNKDQAEKSILKKKFSKERDQKNSIFSSVSRNLSPLSNEAKNNNNQQNQQEQQLNTKSLLNSTRQHNNNSNNNNPDKTNKAVSNQKTVLFDDSCLPLESEEETFRIPLESSPIKIADYLKRKDNWKFKDEKSDLAEKNKINNVLKANKIVNVFRHSNLKEIRSTLLMKNLVDGIERKAKAPIANAIFDLKAKGKSNELVSAADKEFWNLKGNLRIKKPLIDRLSSKDSILYKTAFFNNQKNDLFETRLNLGKCLIYQTNNFTKLSGYVIDEDKDKEATQIQQLHNEYNLPVFLTGKVEINPVNYNAALVDFKNLQSTGVSGFTNNDQGYFNVDLNKETIKRSANNNNNNPTSNTKEPYNDLLQLRKLINETDNRDSYIKKSLNSTFNSKFYESNNKKNNNSQYKDEFSNRSNEDIFAFENLRKLREQYREKLKHHRHLKDANNYYNDINQTQDNKIKNKLASVGSSNKLLDLRFNNTASSINLNLNKLQSIGNQSFKEPKQGLKKDDNDNFHYKDDLNSNNKYTKINNTRVFHNRLTKEVADQTCLVNEYLENQMDALTDTIKLKELYSQLKEYDCINKNNLRLKNLRFWDMNEGLMGKFKTINSEFKQTTNTLGRLGSGVPVENSSNNIDNNNNNNNNNTSAVEGIIDSLIPKSPQKTFTVMSKHNSSRSNSLAKKKLLAEKEKRSINDTIVSRKKFFSRTDLIFESRMLHNKIKPNTRSSGTITIIGNKAFLFGGIGTGILDDMWVLDFSGEGNYIIRIYIYMIGENCVWKYVKPSGFLPDKRYGHTSVQFNSEMVIYGGVFEKGVAISDNIVIFDSISCSYLHERTKSNDIAIWRSHHIAHSAGTYMIVYGGVSTKNLFLNDVILFDLRLLKWIEIKTLFKKDQGIAYHSSALVVTHDKLSNITFHIYLFPEDSLKNNKLKYEGIYVFGGLETTKKQGLIYSNELKILKFGAKPLSWHYPKTKGKLPEARANCTLNYQEELSILILHGGYNGFKLFNDFFIFDLIYFQWTSVNLQARIINKKQSHMSFIKDNYLFIFGGMGINVYEPADILEVNLDIFNTNIKPETDKSMLKKEDDNNNNQSKAFGEFNKFEFIKMLADKVINKTPVDIESELRNFDMMYRKKKHSKYNEMVRSDDLREESNSIEVDDDTDNKETKDKLDDLVVRNEKIEKSKCGSKKTNAKSDSSNRSPTNDKGVNRLNYFAKPIKEGEIFQAEVQGRNNNNNNNNNDDHCFDSSKKTINNNKGIETLATGSINNKDNNNKESHDGDGNEINKSKKTLVFIKSP